MDNNPIIANPIILVLINYVNPYVDALNDYILYNVLNNTVFWLSIHVIYLSKFYASFLSGNNSNYINYNPDWIYTVNRNNSCYKFLKHIEYVDELDASLCTLRFWYCIYVALKYALVHWPSTIWLTYN